MQVQMIENAMPESAKSWLTTCYEHIYFFTKQGEGYVFDTRYEPFVSEPVTVDSQGNSVFGGSKAAGYGPTTYSGKPWTPNTTKSAQYTLQEVAGAPGKGEAGKKVDSRKKRNKEKKGWKIYQ